MQEQVIVAMTLLSDGSKSHLRYQSQSRSSSSRTVIPNLDTPWPRRQRLQSVRRSAN